MKPNFALSLSFDGLRLMHRVAGGWHLVGQVALDNADLTGALSSLRATAIALEPGGIFTKLLIPNDQIKYLALDTTRTEDADVRAALDGATPYSVDELTYDFAKGGGRTYVAAVAKDTLSEAQQFATEHGFNPISFAAVPEPFTFVGEAFFGATTGNTAERDVEPVIVTGTSDAIIAVADDIVAGAPESTPTPVIDTPAPEVDVQIGTQIVTDPIPIKAEPDDVAATAAAPTAETGPTAEITPTVDSAQDGETLDLSAPEPDVEPRLNADDTSSADVIADDAPLFASRLHADRTDGAPAPTAAPIADASDAAPARSEPTFTRTPPPTPLAVPTDQSSDALPPARDITTAAPTGAQVPPAPTIDTHTQPETQGGAPAITGEAATTKAAEPLIATAPDQERPMGDEASQNRSTAATAAATALGAATAVGGAVGGMFASRRMARSEAKAAAVVAAKDTPKDAGTTPDTTSRKTVFGARKQPKPKPVVGGKPRFLGLILTAILLLFLMVFAAFAALSEEGFAAWFGFGSSDTQLAATPETALPSTSDPANVAALEVAAVQPDDASQLATAPDALATPIAPSGGQVLTPEEATRIYAATGVWQRAPRIPLIPRTTSLENMGLGATSLPIVRVPPSPLASSSSVAGDALIATPIDPPAPDETFEFGADGLVVATPEGALTPDGIVVIAGRPPLNPPTRPGTVAPEITPQDQLAAVISDTAVAITDAPEGVIVISGRPVIEPPVRTGTVAPVRALTIEEIARGTVPLLANDGLVVVSGTPSILPPTRPQTVAVAITPALPVIPEAVPEGELGVDPNEALGLAPDIGEDATPEGRLDGVIVIAGSPSVLPPARPGTIAPQNGATQDGAIQDGAIQDGAIQDEAAVDTLTSDVTAALAIGTTAAPTPNTLRPVLRPAAVIQAAAQAANTPVLGALTSSQASEFRPRTRPAGLAPPPEPEPEIEEAAAPAAVAPTGLQLSPEIAAAVEAAANRPNPIVNPTAQAVAVSGRPDTRPRNMARIVARAAQEQQRAATQVAAVPQAAAVAPSGPTAGAVARNATLENAINLRDINLIGIFGGSNDRRALVRMANGRILRVGVGDRLDGGRVTAISAGALSYTKRGRAVTLEVAG